MADQVEEQQFDQARDEWRWLFRVTAGLCQDQVEQRGGGTEGGRVAAYQQVRREGVDDQCGEGAAKLKEAARQRRRRLVRGRLQRQHGLCAHSLQRIAVGTEEVGQVAQQEDAIARAERNRCRPIEVQIAMAIEHQVKAAQFPARRGGAPAAAVLAHMQDGGVKFQAAQQPACQSVGIRMHGMGQAKAASYGPRAARQTTDFD